MANSKTNKSLRKKCMRNTVKVMPSIYLFIWKLQVIKWAQEHLCIEQFFSYKSSSYHHSIRAIYYMNLQGHPEYGLSPFAEILLHCLILLKSTFWSQMIRKQWISMDAIFNPINGNAMTLLYYFICTFLSGTILPNCWSANCNW